MGRRGRPAVPPGLSALLAQAERRRRPTARRQEAAADSWYRIVNADGSAGDAAEVWLYDEIGFWGTTAQDFIDQLKTITTSQINLYVNSPGGDVFDGLAIYQSLLSHPATVHVRVDGLAASAASFIAQAGDSVTVGANAMLMIHDAWGVCFGNAADMQAMGGLLDKISDNIAAIYSLRAGGTTAEWRQSMLAETWYTGAEAVDAGLADEVLDAGKRRKQCATDAMCSPDCPNCSGKQQCPCQDPCPGCPCCGGEGGMEDRMRRAWDLSVFRYAGRDQAPAPDARVRSENRPVDTACPTHHTDVVEGQWDGGAAERDLPSPMPLAIAKAAYGWYDQDRVDNGEIVKAGCKLPHHEVDGDGNPGAAVAAGVRNALSRLPQSDIPEAERAAVEGHLQAHLDDLDAEDHVEPPVAGSDPASSAGDGPPPDPFAAAVEALAWPAPAESGESPVDHLGDSPTTDDTWDQLVAGLAQPDDPFAALAKGLL